MRIAPTAISAPDNSDSSWARDKIRARWIFAGLALMGVALLVLQLFGPNRAIVVSKETTFITEPLGPDGLPDFKAHYIERASKGVTPESNAAVLTWQAMWPGDLDQEHWLPMVDALGLKEIPLEHESLVPVYDRTIREEIASWLAEHYALEHGDEESDEFLSERWQDILRDQVAEALIDRAMASSWTSEQIPALALWAKNNQKPLDLLVEASARPRYYSPSPSFLDGSDPSLIEILLPGAQGMRSGIRALTARAMWHLGEGRTDEAWQDLLACHRLARLLAHGTTMVEQLIAIAIDGVACRSTVILLHHGELELDEARKIHDVLKEMGFASSLKTALNQGERLAFVDSVIRMAHGKMGGEDMTGVSGGAMQAASLTAFDWNYVLREGNRWYDRIAIAFVKPNRDQRKEAIRGLYTEIGQLSKPTRGVGSFIGSIFSRRQRSRMISDVLLSVLLPAFQAANNAEERSVATLEMTRLAAALAVYRAKHGEYPAELVALVPEIIPELPTDLYSGQPLIYSRKDDGGYLLYSVFENGVDGGGTDRDGNIIAGEWVDETPEDFDYGASDLVIRVPTPAFKIPEPPLDELDQ